MAKSSFFQLPPKGSNRHNLKTALSYSLPFTIPCRPPVSRDAVLPGELTRRFTPRVSAHQAS